MLTVLTAASPISLSDLLTAIGSVVTQSVTWIGSFLNQITSDNGLLLLPFALGFALYGIHLMKSLMGR